MTTPETLHPLARQFLEKSNEFGYILLHQRCQATPQVPGTVVVAFRVQPWSKGTCTDP
jgi:hypothetical protein